MSEAIGLFFDEPEDVYHKTILGELSCSAIKQLLRSPAHYRAWCDRELDENETIAKRFGKALHCAVLEPERFAKVYAELPEDAPRRPSITQRNAKKPSDDTLIAIQWWDRWERMGKLTLGRDDMRRIQGMQESARSHPWAHRLLRNGRSEVVARWLDEATGLPGKLRADYFAEDTTRRVVDVKAVVDASFKGFQRALSNYDYPLQQAHYCEGFRRIEKPLDAFVFLAIEHEPPYVCQPYLLDPEAEAVGQMLRERGARILKRCMDANRFPGYSDEIESISLPPWALKDTRGEQHDEQPAN